MHILADPDPQPWSVFKIKQPGLKFKKKKIYTLKVQYRYQKTFEHYYLNSLLGSRKNFRFCEDIREDTREIGTL